jgi:hypothetical protein
MPYVSDDSGYGSRQGRQRGSTLNDYRESIDA